MPVLYANESQEALTNHFGRVLVIGDVVMASRGGAVDDNGIRWVLESVGGWQGSPAPVDGDAVRRVGRTGSSVSDAFLPSRVIPVRCSFAASGYDTEAAIDRLVSAIPLSGLTPVTVHGMGSSRTVFARQEGEILVSTVGSATTIEFSLFTPDPRRYAAFVSEVSTGLPQTSGGLTLPLTLPVSVGAVLSSGRLSVVNEGNAEAPATFTVVGPTPPFTINQVGTGRRLKSALGIPAGRSLVIDGDTRSAAIDGVEPWVVTGSWFDLTPGLNEVDFNAATYNAASRLKVTYRSAWR